MPTVFTIGYEGSDIPRFISVLLAAGVDKLVDVRALPLSRKKGFSKKALQMHLESAGIDYCHYRELGNPKTGRDAARSGRVQLFNKIYRKQFSSPEAQERFEELIQMSFNENICLMCFENDAKTCHRDIITQEMEIRGFDCVNLLGDKPERYAHNTHKLQGCSSCQSLAAAE